MILNGVNFGLGVVLRVIFSSLYFNFFNYLWGEVVLLFIFWRWGKWGKERLSFLVKIKVDLEEINFS